MKKKNLKKVKKIKKFFLGFLFFLHSAVAEGDSRKVDYILHFDICILHFLQFIIICNKVKLSL